MSHKCAEEKLGFVAVDSKTDNIVGVILAADLAESINNKVEQDKEQANPIASLITALNHAYLNGEQIAAKQYLNIKFIAMDSNFKGKGAVMELIGACIGAGIEQGFQYAQAEATGNISQHIFMNKLGFEEKAFIKYSDYEFEGRKAFASITEHQGIKLLIKDIG